MMRVDYSWAKNKHSRRISITLGRDLRVMVRVPRRVNLESAQAFVASKMAWIEKKIRFLQRQKQVGVLLPKGRASYLQFRESARSLIAKEILEVNTVYGFLYHRIAIRDQNSRWGSCSKKGNLNFNYRLIFLPPELRQYVLVHELCHLQEMNHSPRFWQLVSRTVPDYKECRRRLKADFIWS